MTERLADISARIKSVRQLGAVVNAMKSIAASRAYTARTQIIAVDSYAATISAAISSVIAPSPYPTEAQASSPQYKRGLLVFCAEQGFAGAFSERVLDSIASPEAQPLFMVGTRGELIALARGLVPRWSLAMPARTLGISKLADEITKAIYRDIERGEIERLDVIFTAWNAGHPTIIRQGIFPIDHSTFPPSVGKRYLTQIPQETLISDLSGHYFHALVCKAALHAFSAENEARMATMSAAGSQIEQELGVFQATLRRVRQETITAELIELGTGFALSR
ncbi:F0F1 ATP synthase subunit gamma [Halomonas alkaliantarctica]|uniref:F0F1 ATP synthase subunit gamma n=1 Tax=Halomonas alkaliantarctica TaxID=232346 RepID=A0ABY8LIM4_9GAMM|nr:FoF1 ATP synthase subunit gamma [Halomonas alkaliantarctica]WGI24297.1 F0F1 ATP synthase subunit gamma [Halomonas alkaliantarctica]